jgi:DNA invertase Pin-like site-specific DNA recombinase
MNARGYVRVSSKAQDEGMQRFQITKRAAENGDVIEEWFVEKRRGNALARPELERLLRQVRAGDRRRVYVWRIDRFTRRGIGDTFQVVDELRDNQVPITNIDDPLAVDGPLGDVVLAVMGWAGKIDRERINGNIAAARERVEAEGGSWGRPRRVADGEDLDSAREAVRRHGSIRKASAATKIPKSTLDRAMRRAPPELAVSRKGTPVPGSPVSSGKGVGAGGVPEVCLRDTHNEDEAARRRGGRGRSA